MNSIDHDGLRTGYDLALLSTAARAVSIPVVALGGAGALRHLREAVDAGASAVAAGSLFVFYGKHRAVLITYPSRGGARGPLRPAGRCLKWRTTHESAT